MYTDGNIIYFDPFYFKQGDSKRKYFLVLKNMGDNVIIASLPSSIAHLPSFVNIAHGCIHVPDCCVSCYVFEQGRPITKSGWSFDLNTFLHGHWIDDFQLDILQDTYQVEGVEYEIIGQLMDNELQAVRSCFINSNVVKRKYKRMLME